MPPQQSSCCGVSDVAREIRNGLVGENSAGKTSFLAALRFLLEAMSARSQNPFNRDPYFLGGFEQIVHFRGGRGGRPKAFSLTIRVAESPPRPTRRGAPDALSRGNRPKKIYPFSHTFGFVKGSPQPVLETYSFESNHANLAFSFEAETPKVTATTPERRAPFTLDLRRAPPSAIIRESAAYLPYLVDYLAFSPREKAMKEDESSSRGRWLATSDARQLAFDFRASTSVLTQQVFASAPVRTRPLRTYTPSELAASSEGFHVPLELARTKSKSPESWRSIKEGLTDFGKRAGLFTDIDVRHLGKGDVDPFQILVKTTGPMMNIIDVGYGVSQALPIIYQVQNAKLPTTFLLQQPEVHLHPRAQAELGSLFAKAIGNPHQQIFVVETHSDYIVDRVRIEVANKNISKDDVTVIFFEGGLHGSTAVNLYLDQLGEFEQTPASFRGFFLEEQKKVLGL